MLPPAWRPEWALWWNVNRNSGPDGLFGPLFLHVSTQFVQILRRGVANICSSAWAETELILRVAEDLPVERTSFYGIAVRVI